MVERGDEWYEFERIIFEETFPPDKPEMFNDSHLQDLFDSAWFNPDVSREDRLDAREELREYLQDTYDVDFDEVFDWEDWAEWYESQ